MRNGDELYVGYEPRAPAAIARFVRRAVSALLLIAAAVAAALVVTQLPFATSRFEFGVTRTFEGVLVARPYPALLVPRPGSEEFSTYLLSAVGKHGADEAIGPWVGRAVAVEGSLIHRGDRVMVELARDGVRGWDGSAADSVQRRATAGAVDLGSITVVGEIVDSKCFLGVMKPGAWKPHRACAVRCISGGVPPVLVERRGPRLVHFLLVDAEGDPVHDRVLDRVAEPLEISGRLTLRDDQYVLAADPEDYRRLATTVLRGAGEEGAR